MALLKSCSVPEKVKEKVFYGKYLEKSTFFWPCCIVFFFTIVVEENIGEFEDSSYSFY